MSSFVKQMAFANFPRVLLINGMGIDFWLLQHWEHNSQRKITVPPSGFLTSSIGAAAADKLDWMKPFSRCFWMYLIMALFSWSESGL